MTRHAAPLLLVATALVTFVAASASRARHVSPPASPADAPVLSPGTLDDPPLPPDAALRHVARIAPLPVDSAEVARLIDADRDSYIPEVLAGSAWHVERWPVHRRDVARVWIDPAPAVRNWNPQFPSVVASVLPEWTAAGAPMRFELVTDSARGDIRVTWVDGFPDPGQLGLARRVLASAGWIVGSDIAITTTDFEKRPMTEEDVRATARHELGHALGLPHLREEESVMHPTSRALFISPRDAATIRLLYLLPAGSLRAP